MITNKIIHIITTIEFGGAENQLLILSRNQKQQGFEVEIFYLKGRPELKIKFEESGVKVNSLLVDLPFIFQVLRFRQMLKRNDCLVHAHLSQAELVATLACKKNKFIVSRHNFHSFWPNKPRLVSAFLSRLVVSRAAKVIAISNAIKNYLFNAREINRNSKVDVIYYGFDSNKSFLHNSDRIKNKILKSTQDFKLGTIGRLVPGKNYQTMFKAVAQVVTIYPTIKFFIVGGGTSNNDLIRLSKSLGIEDNVVWLGRTELIGEFLSKINLFIFASKGEGFGLVLLEAMIANKPILAANNSAIPEVLGPNYKGLFSTYDYKMLSEKIINIMNDKVESELLVNEYKNQLKLFNPVVMANKVLQAYREAGF